MTYHGQNAPSCDPLILYFVTKTDDCIQVGNDVGMLLSSSVTSGVNVKNPIKGEFNGGRRRMMQKRYASVNLSVSVDITYM